MRFSAPVLTYGSFVLYRNTLSNGPYNQNPTVLPLAISKGAPGLLELAMQNLPVGYGFRV